MEERAISRRRGISIALPVLFACALAPAAQAPEVRIRTAAWHPPGLVITAEANLVELGATVRDKSGRLVGGLKAADFEVLDNNHPRDITVFAELRAGAAAPSVAAAKTSNDPAPAAPAVAPEAPAPRSIALFFDDVRGSMMGVRKSAEAARRLVGAGLAPVDLLAIFTASGSVNVDFTSDRRRILSALSLLKPHPPAADHTSDACPRMTAYQAYAIFQHIDLMAKAVAVAEAVACKCPDPTPACVRAQDQYVQDVAATVWEMSRTDSVVALDVLGIVIRSLAAAPGKRILVLMTPGLLTGGLDERTSALTDIALRANITISGLNSEGLEAPSMGAGGQARWADRSLGQRQMVLSEFFNDAAHSTGGQFVSNNNDLSGALQTVTAVPEVSYVLGFSTDRADGKLHALKTRVRSGSGYHVESRAAYYSAGLTRDTETVQQRIDRIALSAAAVAEFPAGVSLRQEPVRNGRAALHVTISVDAANLKFSVRGGRHVEEFTFLTLLEDAQGNFIAGKQSVLDMALLPASVSKYRKSGIQAVTVFSTAPGAYRVREVVREAAQDHLWAGAAAVQIR